MEVDEKQHLVYESPASAVFNNFDLVVKILEKVTDGIGNNMELRLVNRTFRDAYHVILRRTYRDLKIEYISARSRAPPRPVPVTNDRIYINHCRFEIDNLDNYFHFLRNCVKLKIQSIVLKGLWRLTSFIRLSLHESIRSLIGNDRESLKKLIGMDEICPGNCEDCILIPKECVEYGPLEIDNLRKSFTKPRVFEKLIVPDYLLDDIANICVESTQFKEECLNAASDLIPSNISCKTLILKISEKRKEWVDPELNVDIQRRMRMEPMADHQAMPREVIEVLLKRWKIESIVLKFVHQTHRNDYKGEWTRKGWFTRLCFKDSLITESDPSLKIKEVFVDLTDSLRCNLHLKVHLLTQIRRVFQNDKLKVQFSHYRFGDYSNIARVAGGMMKILNAGAPLNLEVEIINMYLKRKADLDYFDKLSKKEPHLRPVVFRDFHISELPNRIKIILTKKEYTKNNQWTTSTSSSESFSSFSTEGIGRANGLKKRDKGNGICEPIGGKCIHGNATYPLRSCFEHSDCFSQPHEPMEWCDETTKICCSDQSNDKSIQCPDGATYPFIEPKCDSYNPNVPLSGNCSTSLIATCLHGHCCPPVEMKSEKSFTFKTTYETNIPCGPRQPIRRVSWSFCDDLTRKVILLSEEMYEELTKEGENECENNNNCTMIGLVCAWGSGSRGKGICIQNPVTILSFNQTLSYSLLGCSIAFILIFSILTTVFKRLIE